MCCMRLAENTGRKNYAKNRHLRTIAQLRRAISSQLRHASTIGKKLVKWQYLIRMSLQYGEFRPTNIWDLLVSLGHPSKFQRVSCLGFVTAATSFIGGQPNFTRCLAISWAGILYIYIYIHFLGAFAPWRNFARCKLHFASKPCILLYWQHYCMALEQWASAKLCGMVQGMELRNFRRWRHVYSAGQPSHWA